MNYIFDKLNFNPNEKSLFVVEKPMESMETKRKQVELFFEKFKFNGLYFKNSAVLTAFFHSRENAIVIDIGAYNTYVSPVIEGFTSNESKLTSYTTFQIWRRAPDRHVLR